MFGKKAKETARRFKETEPKVDDVKAPDVDLGESFRAEKSEAPKAKKKQTFAEAFKAARDRPIGSGSTFMWNGKSYHIGTKEEEGYRKGGQGPLKRSSTGPASKKPAESKPAAKPAAKAANTASEFIRSGAGPAAGAVAAGRMAGLEIPDLKARRDDFYAKMEARRKAMGMKEPPKPNLFSGFSLRTADSIRADRDAEAARNAASDKARADRQNAADSSFGSRVKEDLEKNKYRTTFAKGGKVGYSKMEKEHVAQMKKHGVPEKYVKEEEKEAKGMKSGGSCGSSMKKYARGGGVESKGKTKGAMIRMASGGSVSARADGIASKGKTNCKIC